MSKKIQVALALSFSLMIAPVAAHGGSPCALVITSGQSSNQTQGLISYLQELLDRQAIGARELALMINESESGTLLNPFSEAASDRDHVASIQRAGVQRFLDSGGVDFQKVREFIEARLQERERVRVKRDEAKKDTTIPIYKIEFHKIGPGSYIDIATKFKAYLPYALEVMSTPVTQAQWVEVMGSNPASFSSGEHRIEVTQGENKIEMQPNHPVESVTWWSALVFANKLSELHGLKPVYDLSGIEWDPSTVEVPGKLNAIKGDVRVNILGESASLALMDLQVDSLARTEGFRLPLSTEGEYLLQSATIPSGEVFLGNESISADNFAWIGSASKQRTQAVRELLPLFVDGKEFFDLFGNVWEWSCGGAWGSGDKYFSLLTARSLNLPLNGHQVLMGNSERNYVDPSGYRSGLHPNGYHDLAGLRLVRTVRE